jgi:phage/plasmid-like protein (TIGR03299 family)
MAHDLEIRADGEASFVAAREPGWHRLGKVYEDVDGLTVATVLDDLDAGEVIGIPVEGTLITPDGVTKIEDPTKMMTVRVRSTGPVPLGVVSKDYKIIQERDAFGFLDNVIDSGEALVSAAGLLNGGRRAFCCMKLPTNVLIGGVDEIEMYALIALSHDGTLALTGAATPIRTVCQNTLTLGIKEAKHVWRVRHTGRSDLKVAEARRALEITYKYSEAFTAEAEALVAAKFTKRQYEGVVKALLGTKTEAADGKLAFGAWQKKYDTVMGLWTADTQDGIKNTAWGAFNALAEYGDWFRGTRGTEDPDAQRFETSLFSGHGAVATLADFKDRAFELVKARAK